MKTPTKMETLKKLAELKDHLLLTESLAEWYEEDWQERKFKDSRDLMLVLEISNERADLKKKIEELENSLLK